MAQGNLLPALRHQVTVLEQEFAKIPEARKQLLRQLADYVAARTPEPVRLNFVCTHNSRRSHLGMIWAAVAAAYYGVPGVETFSGGTEATAFNPRAVAALERAGLRVEHPGGANPRYRVYFAENRPPLTCFSKKYDDPVNPVADFVAVMTCSEAAEACPFIPGAALRLPLTYEDPKVADDTKEEQQRYDERTAQIGRELLYVFSRVE